MNLWLRNFILLALMLAASGMALALRPTHKIAEQGPQIDLQTMIPLAFADWSEEKQAAAQIIDPRTQEMVNKAYSQTLTRTYKNSNGYRIMLSIAYGSDQSDSMQVHKPESCYPAQGFVLHDKQTGTLALNIGSIPVTRLRTSMGLRSEPVTYWITVGDHVVRSGFDKKLTEMSYNLTGKIPDGMLVRVSSIDSEANNAYQMQNKFSAQMLEALTPEHRQRLTGNLQLN